MIDRFDEADTAKQKATAEKESEVEEELLQEENMRNFSLETFSQTRKRKENDTGEGSQKISHRLKVNIHLIFC